MELAHEEALHDAEMRHAYRVTGMSCGSCASKIKRALETVSKVSRAEVTLNPPRASVTMRGHIETEVLNRAIANVGDYGLVDEQVAIGPNSKPSPNPVKAYFPLILIAVYLIGGVLLREAVLGRFDWHAMMANFMGGFFVIFSFFKLLDLKGFAEGYGTYDIVAAKFPAYGILYPFIELSLGMLYFSGADVVLTNALTLLVMGVSSIGVIRSFRAKRPFQCACLGTIFKLPLTKVTLAEDLLMVSMAALMLVTA